MPSQTQTRTRKIVIRVIAIVLALLICGALYDLFYPRTTKMREFDPDEVARLETAMWRSYYEQRRLALFSQLAELLRTQYRIPPLRSNLVAYYAADAAFVFKKGHERSGYEQALPELIRFYGAIRKMSDIPFDVDRAAAAGARVVDHSSPACPARTRRFGKSSSRIAIRNLSSAG